MTTDGVADSRGAGAATARRDRFASLAAAVGCTAFEDELTTAMSVLRKAGTEGVYLSFPSVTGRALAKLVTVDRFEGVARQGIRLHFGSIADARANIFGELIGFRENEVEALGVPDLQTLRLLPWAARFARVLCFLYEEETGDPLDHDSRGNLLRLEDEFERETGFQMLAAIEPEMMWLRRSADGQMSFPSQALSVYSYANFNEYEPLITDLLDFSRQMGLRVHGVDSEESGQLEVNQVPATPLAFADDFFTYRQICRIAGRKHGLTCTFMPKPFVGESGNGAHHNLSLLDASGGNALIGDGKGRCRLSRAGCGLIGGLLEHADATTLIGASTINSYKRFWDLGHWASFYKAYGYNNRTCLLRVSAVGRVEVRHFDSASNPYHTLACCLGTGLDGMARDLDPGEAVSDNVFRDIRVPREERIPLTPDEAIAAFRADDLMKHVFRPGLYQAILALRVDEWQRYWVQVSEWERQFYLERWP